MFIQTWNRYLPVIRILLKRSAGTDQPQVLDMNKSDFQRATGGKKIKFTFSFVLVKSKLSSIQNAPPVAKDLVAVLQQDDISFRFLQQNEVEFTMNNNFQLLMKNNTPAAEVQPAVVAEELVPGASPE